MSKEHSQTSLTYRKIDATSQEKILQWLEKPHVKEFFRGEGIQNLLKDLQAQVSSHTSRCQHWIASKENVPFGYLITSRVEKESEEDKRFTKHMDPSDSAITLDLLIGEESHLGQGLASAMIRAFLLEKFPQVTKVFIDPEATNKRAIHVYEKVGFRKLETFIAEWLPVIHWQMMLEMKHLLNPQQPQSRSHKESQMRSRSSKER